MGGDVSKLVVASGTIHVGEVVSYCTRPVYTFYRVIFDKSWPTIFSTISFLKMLKIGYLFYFNVDCVVACERVKKNKLRSEAIVHYMLFIFCDICTMIEKTVWIDSMIFSTFIINLQFDNFLQCYYNNIYWTLKNNVSTLLFKKWIHLYLFMIMLFIIKIVLMKLENNSIIYIYII